MADAKKFAVDLDRFADKVELDLAQFRRRVTLGLKEKIERRTPVDTGRLRASWAVSDGKPSTYVPPEGMNSPAPVQAQFGNPFETSFIVSNLPYTVRVEFGYSKQAPQGMVRVSMAEMITELETAFGEL
tara:strand:+ start:1112 stop:1498 length:387 start_codon:yes stop_codon:yes gene_type:complete